MLAEGQLKPFFFNKNSIKQPVNIASDLQFPFPWLMYEHNGLNLEKICCNTDHGFYHYLKYLLLLGEKKKKTYYHNSLPKEARI